MATFVLIHGAWHGGWCWERLVPLLEAEGHSVFAPDLPGMGSDTTPFADDVLGQWTDAISALIEAQQEPVILAGHSRGGIVISSVAERIPDRIARLVYVTAFLVPDGASLMNLAGQDPDSGPAKAMIMSADGRTITMDAAHTREIFYNGMTDRDVAAANARLTPEPLAAVTTPIHVSEARFGRVPRAYIEAQQDNAISLAVQRRMQAGLPCDPVISLPSDHSPFYSMPEALAGALLGLV